MKLVFVGTSDFAVPQLEALVDDGQPPALVISQPDRPAGRGRRRTPSPVSRFAEGHGLPLRRPERLNDATEIAALAAVRPDMIIVSSFGQILKAELLHLPPRGCINVHASLLPAWRGAAPVAHALLAGDDLTGVTLMQMDEGLDTGPILAQEQTIIDTEDDRGRLTGRLARLGAGLLLGSLPLLAAGRLTPRAQDSSRASLAPSLRKVDGLLDWEGGALAIVRRVRAFTPRPGAFTFAGGRRLLVRAVRLAGADDPVPTGVAGTLGEPLGDAVPVRCGDGQAVLLLRVQPQGSVEMDAAAAARGRRLSAGMILTSR